MHVLLLFMFLGRFRLVDLIENINRELLPTSKLQKIKQIHTNPNQTWTNLEYPPPPKNSNSHIDVKPMVGWVRHGGRDFDIF